MNHIWLQFANCILLLRHYVCLLLETAKYVLNVLAGSAMLGVSLYAGVEGWRIATYCTCMPLYLAL